MSLVKMKLIGLLVLVIALAGCGDKAGNETGTDHSSESLSVATVGDVEILSDYYEDRLAVMELDELPRDENGKPVDTLTLEGKKEFVGVLINKELMVMEARNQGYHQRVETEGAQKALLATEGEKLLWAAVDETPVPEPTNEEIEEIYANLGRERTCNFVITNFIEDAEAAREMALSGADWEDVVAKYHDGNNPPDGEIPEVNVPYGRYSEEFDTRVYGVEVGSMADPIDTGSGFWLLKVVSEKKGDQPSRAEAEPMIRDLLKRRGIARVRAEYRDEVNAAHKMYINEEALILAFNGLPQGEGTLDPETKKPLAADKLSPMDIPAGKESMVLFSYEIEGETTEMTLGEYKGFFDRANVFVRPKSTGMLGGLRGKLEQDMGKIIIADQVKIEGWDKNQEVLDKVKDRIDQIITMALFKESVVVDDVVTDEDRAAFWVDHSSDYYVPEVRLGVQVICRNQELAVEAAALANKGEAWNVIMDKYDTSQNNKLQKGQFQAVENDGTPLTEAVFALATVGDVTPPFALENGKFGVAMLETVTPRRDDVPMAEVQDGLDKRILGLRQESEFQSFLDSLRAKYPIVIHEENLPALKGWKELYAARQVAETL